MSLAHIKVANRKGKKENKQKLANRKEKKVMIYSHIRKEKDKKSRSWLTEKERRL